MKLPLIAQDKANHFVYGALGTFAVQLMSDPLTALIVCGLVAAAKEFYDHVSKKGTPDLFDFLWTLGGGAVVALSYWSKSCQVL